MNENDKCSTDGLTIPRGRFPQDTPLAMAYVPCQKFTENFTLSYGLSVGTIFPQLCKPFCGKRGGRR